MFLRFLAFLFCALGLLTGTVRATTPEEPAAVRLVAGVEAVGTETEVPLGLEVKLAPGWHTYWRSPGESGAPPQLDATASQNDVDNLESLALAYPAPRRFAAFGMESIGYADTVVFPLTARLKKPGAPLTLKLKAEILVCGTLCLPKNFDLTLTLPAGEAQPSADAELLKTAQARVPGATHPDFAITDIFRTANELRIKAKAEKAFTKADLFVETEKSVPLQKMELQRNCADKESVFTLRRDPGAGPDDATLLSTPLTLTLVDNDKGLSLTLPAQTEAPSTDAGAFSWNDLLGMILLALLGGFILNLMPCVLPVLSLKVLSVASHGGGTRSAVRRSFLMTASGIVFSFLALAAITVALRQAGHAVGWGVQFQEPLYLTFLTLVLTFFTANLWGFFEIPLPRFIADRLDPLYHPKLAGDFATGALATLLATPCTAPFLGTAIGFGLRADGPVTFLIFTALGLGMAIPYLLIALRPGLATALPRPGRWMERLRVVLGFALALTVLWLLYVLTAEIGPQGGGLIGACSLLLLAILAVRGRSRRGGLASGLLAVLLTLGAFGVAWVGATPTTPASGPRAATSWQAFDADAIPRHAHDRKTVFVDVTAAWCLTCKANKKFVLDREEIRARLFGSPDIVAMQADWTNADPAIAAWLRRYGRYGIPFNAVFGPGAPEGLLLPELLTPAAVLKALDRASAQTPVKVSP